MDDMTCPFCNPSDEEAMLANDLCYARYDKYPVNPGHLLIIPFRHIAGFFDATDGEQAALLALVREAGETVSRRAFPTRRLQHRRERRRGCRADGDAPACACDPAVCWGCGGAEGRGEGGDPGEEAVLGVIYDPGDPLIPPSTPISRLSSAVLGGRVPCPPR